MNDERKIGLNGLDRRISYRFGPVNENRIDSRDIVTRSIDVQRASPGRRHAKMLGLPLALGVAVVIVSAMSVIPFWNQKAAPPLPANTSQEPPPYTIAGITYDAMGEISGSCYVKVTDLESGNFTETTSSSTSGFYSVQLTSFEPDYDVGDRIHVYASNGGMYGENESVVVGYSLALNVTLNLVIPEFPTLIVPVLGVMGLLVAASVIYRRD